ncbi:VWA domain-containing protein [Synechococcus sp. Nb3U1]|uniref:vWA domain-containing protein n=1 Tax=Synechococcus sp. Nb3U1 TaxID=1914529 RepID=UPI001F30999A|nr:VWA domain-containing protein [Synechococcus sp. Nb3U1]MCF2970118.1 VWA domain-containing protein [Synechococcus sp. Nb3U1]
MEFSISLLEQRDPPRPVTQLAVNEIGFRVDRVTDLVGIPQPTSLRLIPSQVQNPSPDLTRQPLAMALLMDSSGSLFVTDRQDRRFSAAFDLLQQFRSSPLDLGAILRFDNQGIGFGTTALGRPLRTAQLLQDFTSDQAALRRGILLSTPGGNTALYDATLETAQFLSDFRQSENLNRRLVVFTDGIDNESLLSLREVTRQVQQLPNGSQRGIPAYIVGLGTDLNLFELQQLAEATQGTFVLARVAEDLGPPFANLFPAAIGENRVAVRVETTSPLAAGNYLLSGSLQISRGGLSLTTEFRDAVLVVR